MSIRTIIRRVIATPSGNGFVASVVKAGTELAVQLRLIGAENKPALVLEQAPSTFRPESQVAGVQTTLLGVVGEVQVPLNAAPALSISPMSQAGTSQAAAMTTDASLRGVGASSFVEKPALALALLGATGAASVDNLPAIVQAARISDFKVQEAPAFDIVQITYNLTRRIGGNAVTETAVAGRTDWASDANAISGTGGVHDGSSATFAANALGARGGQLELSYTDAVGKGDLTITSAKLYFYGNVAGTLLNNADVQLKYDVGAGFVTLETITGNADFSVTPKIHDITAALTDWTKYNALRTACYASSALGEGWTAACDAVEIEILATRTDTP